MITRFYSSTRPYVRNLPLEKSTTDGGNAFAYDNYYNGKKTFSMSPPEAFDQTLTADQIFTAQARLGVRIIVYFPAITHRERQAVRRPPLFLPKPTPAAPALLDSGLIREATASIAHDLPEVGSDVTITQAYNKKLTSTGFFSTLEKLAPMKVSSTSDTNQTRFLLPGIGQ